MFTSAPISGTAQPPLNMVLNSDANVEQASRLLRISVTDMDRQSHHSPGRIPSGDTVPIPTDSPLDECEHWSQVADLPTSNLLSSAFPYWPSQLCPSWSIQYQEPQCRHATIWLCFRTLRRPKPVLPHSATLSVTRDTPFNHELPIAQ